MAFRDAICEDLPVTIEAFQGRRPDLRLSYSDSHADSRGINSTAFPPPSSPPRSVASSMMANASGSSRPSRRVRRPATSSCRVPGTFLYRAVYGHLHGKSC
jgi:hypothetical protein